MKARTGSLLLVWACAWAVGCGREAPVTLEVPPERAPNHNVRAITGAGIELHDGTAVVPPAHLPEEIWRDPEGRVVTVVRQEDLLSLGMEVEGHWSKVARRYEEVLLGRGWKLATGLELADTTEKLYALPDGSTLRLFAEGLPDGRAWVVLEPDDSMRQDIPPAPAKE